MMKSRHLEEIREARRKEAEARQEQRKSKLVRSLCGNKHEPGIDYAVGGGQGLDAQEEEEKVTSWHRLGLFREQLERRASQSKKGFICLIITVCDLTVLHGSTSI